MNILKEMQKEIKKDSYSIFYLKYRDEKKNIFKVALDKIYFYIVKYILKKENKKLEYTKNFKNNFKVDTVISILLSAILMSSIFLIMKITSINKENYGDYDLIQNNTKNIEIGENNTSENMNNTSSIDRIDERALEEEIEAQASYKNTSYSFNVARNIKTIAKIHLFNSANWSDYKQIIPENTEFEVNYIVSPGGYMMYKIASGDYAGYFITANEKLIMVDRVNDNLDLKFIAKPIAIKLQANQNTYKEATLKNVKAIAYKNVVLNIKGYGAENNRLIYYIEDGSFLPIDLTKTVETQRKSDENASNNKNKSKNNSATKKTTTTKKKTS
ncbi:MULTISPECIES: hypothetical protein [unclassified Gemella]|uniref:hypothetical protein n=1 Tax=unclassified Gemella TaxID=2624949 RepID=UPI001C03BB49|nr:MULTISPECIES: hypothetical protein [unclassified Gemella]MBU0278258.1 hypothetical protein [Gemella sp. zg-1178]QWQ38234.1 hypothetical protein KMP11_04515 [Gemella sp. zg-570]